jgi:hypothetical protein
MSGQIRHVRPGKPVDNPDGQDNTLSIVRCPVHRCPKLKDCIMSELKKAAA